MTTTPSDQDRVISETVTNEFPVAPRGHEPSAPQLLEMLLEAALS